MGSMNNISITNISKQKVLEILDQRMTELKKIKEQNKYRGITMRDEYLIDGGIYEIEILKERIKEYFKSSLSQ